ncbi:SAF domain-containing protein [Endozoicomonas ascidiicola]|uniref:SAF domain-containing protein n=1 Tax=Endozoicomonas ascidiicola TaxID=1698521 RepID=UPI000AE6FD37
MVRRSVTFVSDVPANKPIQESDVILLRPGTGIPPKDLNKVIGRCLKASKERGAQINWQDLV